MPVIVNNFSKIIFSFFLIPMPVILTFNESVILTGLNFFRSLNLNYIRSRIWNFLLHLNLMVCTIFSLSLYVARYDQLKLDCSFCCLWHNMKISYIADERSVCVLEKLAFIFKPRVLPKSNNDESPRAQGIWKPSRQEVQNSFLLRVNVSVTSITTVYSLHGF